MAKYRTLYCSHCCHERTFRKPRVNHLQSFALTILTAGIYLVFWVATSWRRFSSPWRCRVCHHSWRGEENEAAVESTHPEPLEVGR